MVKEEIYKIIDSFLVEAKDQNGRERSLEQLNRDRHLAAERFEEVVEQTRQETINDIIEILEKMKKNDKVINLTNLMDKRETMVLIAYNQALSDAIRKIKSLALITK